MKMQYLKLVNLNKLPSCSASSLELWFLWGSQVLQPWATDYYKKVYKSNMEKLSSVGWLFTLWVRNLTFLPAFSSTSWFYRNTCLWKHTFLVAYSLSIFTKQGKGVELCKNCLMKPHGTQDSLLNRDKQGNSDSQKHLLSPSKKILVTLSWLMTSILHWRNHKMCKVKGKPKAGNLYSLQQDDCCSPAALMAAAGLWQNRDLKPQFGKALNYMLKGMAAGLFFLLLLQHKDEFKIFYLFLKFKISAY